MEIGMGHRKVINRMVKAQRISSSAMNELADVGGIGIHGDDVDIHNVCVESYNVHVKIWNQLQRYITSLKSKKVKNNNGDEND